MVVSLLRREIWARSVKGVGSLLREIVEYSTEKSGPDAQVLDITLPAGAEVITVWFRYSGPPSSGVGFDWIKLKDITGK